MDYEKTEHFYGKSGKAYLFRIFHKDVEFESGAAVYIFLKKTGEEYIPLYIGQTQNIGDRFEGHDRKKCAARYGWTHIALHQEISHAARLQKETDLRHKYQTPCNRQ